MVTRPTLQRIRHGIEALATQVLRKPVRFVWAGIPSGPDGETAEAATERDLAEHPEARGYELIVLSWLPATRPPIWPEAKAKAAISEGGDCW
jgi:hypothetical protein